jgi:hypothetical protein
MRTSKKKASGQPTAADKDFERLYRTIPTAYGTKAPAEWEAPGAEKPSRRWKKILKRLLIVLALLLVLGGLWTGWKFLSNGAKIFGWQGLKDIFTSKELRGEDEGRVNILLAGNSTDDPGHSGAALTDSRSTRLTRTERSQVLASRGMRRAAWVCCRKRSPSILA